LNPGTQKFLMPPVYCGWLCPLGLIQELFYKIPTPKVKKNRFTHALSYLKYVLLHAANFLAKADTLRTNIDCLHQHIEHAAVHHTQHNQRHRRRRNCAGAPRSASRMQPLQKRRQAGTSSA